MPNGHGGIPRYGSPVFLSLILLGLLGLQRSHETRWTLPLAYLVAGLVAWRFAWHLHLYDLMEYDGAYASPAELQAAKRRYRWTMLFLVPAALVGVHVLWP